MYGHLVNLIFLTSFFLIVVVVGFIEHNGVVSP